MRRKAASILGLLGFATVALVSAVTGGDFVKAVPRAIFAAVAMAVLGYLTGLIAEKAVSEAVDTKAPLYVARREESEEKTDTAGKEEK